MAYRELGMKEMALTDLYHVPSGFLKSDALIGELLYFTSQKRTGYKKALAHLRKWLKNHPSDYYFRYWVGACYNQLDCHPLALRHMLICADNGYLTENVVEGLVTEFSVLYGVEVADRRVAKIIDLHGDFHGQLAKCAKRALVKITKNRLERGGRKTH